MGTEQEEPSDEDQAKIDAIMRVLSGEPGPADTKVATPKTAKPARPLTAEDFAKALGVEDLSDVPNRRDLFAERAAPPSVPPEVPKPAPAAPARKPEPVKPAAIVAQKPAAEGDPIGDELRRQASAMLSAYGLNESQPQAVNPPLKPEPPKVEPAKERRPSVPPLAPWYVRASRRWQGLRAAIMPERPKLIASADQEQKAKPRKVVKKDRKYNPRMYLGSVIASDNTNELDKQILRRRKALLDDEELSHQDRYDADLMPFNEYVRSVEKYESYSKNYWKNPDYFSYAQRIFFFKPFIQEIYLYTPDVTGWHKYLRKRAPELMNSALGEKSRKSDFPEAGRQGHTLILGGSNWGKSELIKALAYHYVQDGSAACVVLDPGGDLVKQMMQWPELVQEDRLRIVQPGLLHGKTIGINPFDVRARDVEQRREIANDWAITLGEITSDLSPNMQLLVVNCVQVLLAYPDRTTLRDLYKILMERPKAAKRGEPRPPPSDKRAAELQEFARRYEVATVAEFFRHDFDDDGIASTRYALRRRIGLVMNLPHAEAMLCGETTLDLEKEIEARRFILVDLARFGEIGGAQIGRLFVAMVAAIGRRREAIPRERRTSTHLIIDEVSTMVSPRMLKVLKELRKFGVYQTLAQQRGGDAMTPEQAGALRTNTACKLIAPADEVERWVFDLPDGYTVPKLNPGEFLTRWNKPREGKDPGPMVLRVRSDLKDYSHKVSAKEWAEFLEWLPIERGGYFRSAVLPQTGDDDEAGEAGNDWPDTAKDEGQPVAVKVGRASAVRVQEPPQAAASGDRQEGVPPELQHRIKRNQKPPADEFPADF